MKRLIYGALSLATLLVLGTGTASSADCVGDLNGDNVIDGTDDAVFEQAFEAEEGDDGWVPAADLNGDGMIGGADYLLLQQAKTTGC